MEKAEKYNVAPEVIFFSKKLGKVSLEEAKACVDFAKQHVNVTPDEAKAFLDYAKKHGGTLLGAKKKMRRSRNKYVSSFVSLKEAKACVDFAKQHDITPDEAKDCLDFAKLFDDVTPKQAKDCLAYSKKHGGTLLGAKKKMRRSRNKYVSS